jgi:hypothetical protein
MQIIPKIAVVWTKNTNFLQKKKLRKYSQNHIIGPRCSWEKAIQPIFCPIQCTFFSAKKATEKFSKLITQVKKMVQINSQKMAKTRSIWSPWLETIAEIVKCGNRRLGLWSLEQILRPTRSPLLETSPPYPIHQADTQIIQSPIQ